MKLHKVLVEAVVNALYQIFFEDKYADKVIERVLASNKKWGARDRAFIAETTYEMVRWWRLIAHCEGNTWEQPNGLWRMFGTWHLLQDFSLPAWAEFQDVPHAQIVARYASAKQNRAIVQSIPDWMDSLCANELGDVWTKELTALNQTAPVILRANMLKTTTANLRALLQKDGIDTDIIPEVPTALKLRKRQNLFTTEHFKNGFFEIQDAGSQLIGDFLGVKPGMRVIDACAGAGGKTLQLSAAMQNKGQLIAMDIEGYKLTELRRRATRAGAANVETRTIENSKTIKRLHDSADRLLLDVPCSGLGVLRRNPDAKWKLKADFIEKVTQTQRDILSSYPQMLKSGGEMVYATCSILPSEDERQIEWFLAQNDNFELVKEHRVSPSATGFDGFYMALLRKK
jgi:16S rRNA (cytosine967-C5)-methyltransferase